MMTVFYKPMRRRRWMRIEAGQAPPTWKTFPMGDKGVSGSAKPGRGGRRKRKAWQAIRRDMAARCRHLDAQRALPKGQKRRFVYRARFRRWIMRDLDRVWNEGPGLKPPPGRRERRRRAKLRRRRARREVERRAKRFAPPTTWRALAKNWAFRRVSVEHATGEALDQLAEIYGVKRTPGA